MREMAELHTGVLKFALLTVLVLLLSPAFGSIGEGHGSGVCGSHWHGRCTVCDGAKPGDLLVRHIGGHQFANIIFDPAVRLCAILYEGRGAGGSEDAGNLPWHYSFCHPAADRAYDRCVLAADHVVAAIDNAGLTKLRFDPVGNYVRRHAAPDFTSVEFHWRSCWPDRC